MILIRVVVSESNGLSDGGVAGVIIATLIIITLLCGVGIYLKRKKGYTFGLAVLQSSGGISNAAYDKYSDTINITAMGENHSQEYDS